MMASRTLHLAAVALGCILMSFSCSALPFPPPWVQETEPPNTAPVGGFHLKLAEDISISASSGSTLASFSVYPGDNGELFLEDESGFDNIRGVFRPSNGLYHLSTLVHLSAAVPQDQDPAAAVTTPAVPQDQDPAVAVTTPAVEDSEKPPQVTVTLCINDNCGSSSILKSSSSLPSSGDLQTVSISGILRLKRGQKVTVKVDNHSTNRQVVVSEQSVMSAYLLKAHLE